MTVYAHTRFGIYSSAQHPYKHDPDEFFYSNPAFGDDVTNMRQALDYVTAVLFPKMKPAVANVAALPAVGNTINDMRVVNDDGDGKAASYRWELREGEVAASWHKIYDVDFGTDSILQAWNTKTQDVYVSKYGYDELDNSGVVIAGDLSGQKIYGGASANTHLTLYANSGDGVGANTGFVQFGDQVRPTSDAAISLGTTARRWLKVWSGEVQSGTLNLVGGTISDSSGAISFADENLSTTGTLTVGSTLINGATISNTSGTISFADENLTTTGTITANSVTATGAASSFASGTTVGNLTLSSGQITDSSGTISFDNEHLTTTGNITGAILTGSRLDVDNLRIDGNTFSATNVDGGVIIAANGTGVVDIQSALTTLAVTTTGVMSVTGQFNADNLRIDGNIISSTNLNGAITLSPNGTGFVETAATLHPTSDNSLDLGTSVRLFRTLYLGTSIHNGTNQILVSEILSLRNVLFRDAARTQAAQTGDALFYDAVSGTFLASVPDTEITHSTLSGLTTSDAGHTQFVMLAGRAGGQSIQGGTAASENLNLESTSHGTKGFIQAKDSIRAFTDASYSGSWSGADLGGSSNRFRHVYTAGEYFGLRLENVGANPASSAQNIGRLVWNTGDSRVYVDTGSAFIKVGDQNRFESDTVWNGTDLTKNVTVTTTGMDARKALWQLRDNNNDFQEILCTLKATSASNVSITTTTPLTAGTYRLIGLE